MLTYTEILIKSNIILEMLTKFAQLIWHLLSVISNGTT